MLPEHKIFTSYCNLVLDATLCTMIANYRSFTLFQPQTINERDILVCLFSYNHSKLTLGTIFNDKTDSHEILIYYSVHLEKHTFMIEANSSNYKRIHNIRLHGCNNLHWNVDIALTTISITSIPYFYFCYRSKQNKYNQIPLTI